MENQKYAKIIKIVLWVLMILSICVLVWGFFTGFEANDGAATNVLLYWAYIVLGIALVSVICIGLYITAVTNPKGLIKIGIAVVAAAYSGAKLPTATELKMTDTILNLAYLVGGAAILSIVVSEVFMTIRNKK